MRRESGEGSPEPLRGEGGTQLPHTPHPGVSLCSGPQYSADGRMNEWRMENVGGEDLGPRVLVLAGAQQDSLPPPKRKATREFCSFPDASRG